MRKTQESGVAQDRLKVLITAAIVTGAIIGTPSAICAETAKETPLVSCMVRKASPANREAVADAVQASVYCPPSLPNASDGVICPTGENYRLQLKRVVFELARECSKEFPVRAALPEVEAGFLESLGREDTVKLMVQKRKDAYEKSKADFGKAQPAKDTKRPSGN